MLSHLASLVVFDLRTVVYLNGVVSVGHMKVGTLNSPGKCAADFGSGSGNGVLSKQRGISSNTVDAHSALARGSGTGCLSRGEAIEALLL